MSKGEIGIASLRQGYAPTCVVAFVCATDVKSVIDVLQIVQSNVQRNVQWNCCTAIALVLWLLCCSSAIVVIQLLQCEIEALQLLQCSYCDAIVSLQ